MIHTVSSSCVLFISNWFSGRLGIDTVDTFTSRVAIFLEFRVSGTPVPRHVQLSTHAAEEVQALGNVACDQWIKFHTLW